MFSSLLTPKSCYSAIACALGNGFQEAQWSLKCIYIYICLSICLLSMSPYNQSIFPSLSHLKYSYSRSAILDNLLSFVDTVQLTPTTGTAIEKLQSWDHMMS